MANTYIKIGSVSVGASGNATIEFTDISQNYTDLKMVFSLRSDRAAAIDIVYFKFNNASTNYTNREFFGSGSAIGTNPDTSMAISYSTAANATASTFANGELYIPKYASGTLKASSGDIVSENNATAAYQTLQSNLWANSAAVTSILIYPVLGTKFVQYSTATLYGIKSS